MKATPPPAMICNTHHQRHTKKYRRGRHLGVGGFANVYSVESLDSHRIYACKVINKSMLRRREHQTKLVSEIKLHRSLSHAHIVRFENYFDDDENVYILLEVCRNHSLMELLRARKRLSEPEVRFWTKQMISALKFLHGRDVIHRDLKLGNLLLDEKLHIKLCDFGLAAQIKDGARKTTICGTPNYIAPEILNQRKLGQGHSYEVDVWSLGVIMFTLLAGAPPFETRNLHETYRRVKEVHYRWPSAARNVSADAKALVGRILNVDPAQRPNLTQIEAHDFFTKHPMPRCLPLAALHREPRADELGLEPATVSTTSRPIRKRAPIAPNQNLLNRNTNRPQQPPPPRIPLVSAGFASSSQSRPKSEGVEERKETSPTATAQCSASDFVFVVQHCDYSKKYGLGYILSDASTGIHFNDSTKICLRRDRRSVSYVDDAKRVRRCSLERYPTELSKKVKLLQYFKSHLWKEVDRRLLHAQGQEREQEMVYVKRWMKEKYAMVFALSNGTVQVNFADASKLVFDDNAAVLYQDKNGGTRVYSLLAMERSTKSDLKKRFKYAKQLISKLQAHGR